MNCETTLQVGLQAMQIEATPVQQQQLLSFLAMLVKWNQHFNLTAVRSPIDMVRRHLLDSLSISHLMEGKRVLDVGTGAGLPGIPLSILDSTRDYYLLDSNQKRQIFVSQVIRELSLNHAHPVLSLVQAYQPAEKFSTIVTRAFAPLLRMIALTQHLLENEGRFIAMMGKATEDLLVLPPGFEIENLASLNVPGESAQRHVAVIKKGKVHGG